MLKNIVPVGETIRYGDNTFNVHGISLTNLVSLMGDFEAELNSLMAGETSLTSLAMVCPQLVENMILMASHEEDCPEVREAIRALPIGVQGKAVEAIWDLTLPDEDWLGKFLNRLMDAMDRSLPSRGSAMLQQSKQPPKSGKKRVSGKP